MVRKQLRLGKGFHVAIGNRRSQAAEMVLAHNDREGDSENRHRGADQWLYVVAGEGMAIINGKRYPLKPQTLVLIERGDKHEIRNTGKEPLKTVNIYVPPAYSSDGEELPAGQR